MICEPIYFSNNIWFNDFTFPVHILAEGNIKRLQTYSTNKEKMDILSVDVYIFTI